MAQELINIGAAPSDGSGDPIRVSFDKINKNFSELYTQYTDIAANVAIINNPVLTVAGKTGRVQLTATDIIGGVTIGYVNNKVTEQINIAMRQLLSDVPDALSSIHELANAISNNPDVAVEILTQLSAKLPKSGGTMTGAILLHAMPTEDAEAANKQYVDSIALPLTNAINDINSTLATPTYYTKSEIDLMLLNITSNNNDWGFIGNDDWGFVNEAVTLADDFGSI